MKQLFYDKNTIKLFERKNNTRHVTGQELPPFGKFVTEVLIFAAPNTFFSAESDIYRWQSHRFLCRTPLKTRHKPQKQPLELFCEKGAFKYFSIWSLFLIGLWAFRPATLLKRHFDIGVFLWNLRNFWEHLLWRTSPNDCFWNLLFHLDCPFW